MAKKKTEKATGIDLNDAQKRMDQYVNTGATTVAGADEVQGTKLADIVTQ